MQKTLLIETLLPSEANVMYESSADGKDIYLKGIFMQGEIKNRNGRTYPLKEIQGAVQSLQEQLKMQSYVMGELDHPQTLQINLDRVSHVITEVKCDGNNAVGKLKLLSTPMGMIAKEFVRNGLKIGISSRGAGSVMEEGRVSGFTVVTCDLVATPSAPGAVLDSVYESVMNAKNGGKILTLAETVRHDPKAQKYLQKEIVRLIDKMLG